MILTIEETEQFRSLLQRRASKCEQMSCGNWERLKFLHRKMLDQPEPIPGMVNGIKGVFTPRS